MAWCLFLPLNACPTLYRCTSTFPASTAQLFLCMAGITKMCSIKKKPKKNPNQQKNPKPLHFLPSPLLCPNTHQRRKATSPASTTYFKYYSFSHLSGIMARDLPFSPHFPLSRAVCVPSGKVNPQTVEAKEMRGEGRTVDFIFNSHKKLLPTGTRLHCSYFSPLSLQTKIYQLDSTTVPWNSSDPSAFRPLIPKTPLSLSHLLFSYRDWSTLCVSEGPLLPAGRPCSITKKEERHWQRGTHRGCHFLSY